MFLSDICLIVFSLITLMIIENRALWLAMSFALSPGGHLGIFWVGICRPGLQFGTPLKTISPKIDTPF